MHKALIIAVTISALVCGGRAYAEEALPPGAAKPPAPAEPATIALNLTAAEAADLLTILDIAIKASGYSRITLGALRIGQKLEQAGSARAALPQSAP